MFDVTLYHYVSEHYELKVKAEERAWREQQRAQGAAGVQEHVLARVGQVLVAIGYRLQQEQTAELGRACNERLNACCGQVCHSC